MEESQADEIRIEFLALRSRIDALEKRLGFPLAGVPKQTPIPAPRPSSTSSESHEAGKVLGLVAVVCFMLAASFLIKLSIDSGWLTPARQLGLAALLGGGFIGVGLFAPRRDVAYLGLLPAAGVVILYMAAYGGNLYYGLYGSWTATLAACAVSIAALGLFDRFKSDFFFIVAVAGTYLCTLLLPAVKGATFDSMFFFVVWDIAFAALAVRFRSRPMLLLSCYLAIGAFAAASPTVNWNAGASDLVRASFFQFLQFVLFSGSIGCYSVRNRQPLTVSEAWAFFPVLLFFYGTEYSLIARISSEAAPWIALCFAGVVYAIYEMSRDKLAKASLESGAMVNAFIAVVLFHAFYLELLPQRFSPWFAVFMLLLAPVLGRSLEPRGRHWPFAAALLAVWGSAFLKIFFGYYEVPALELCALNLIFGILLLAAYSRETGSDAQEEQLWFVALMSATAQALMGLYRLPRHFGLGAYERFAVTSLWGAFAIALLLWAEKRRDQQLARSAIFVLGVSAAKGLLFDVSANQPVVRIICLLVLGSALYLSGFLLRRTAAWGKTSSS